MNSVKGENKEKVPMNPPVDDFYLWDLRTNLELDQDLIAGTDGYLFSNTLPPDWQIGKMKELPSKFDQDILKLKDHKVDAGNEEYKQQLLVFINDLRVEAKSLITKLDNARL